LLPREIIVQRLQRLHAQDAEREAELKAMFNEAGCNRDQIQEQMVRSGDPPNVVCTLPGKTNALIIVAAHSDHVEKGTGAVDDWSGASLLPSLYQTLKQTQRKHTFQFVGFTDEEKGLVGSNFYVRRLSEDERASIKAVVNLECLGVSYTKVWAHMANPELLDDLVKLTESMHVRLQKVNVESIGNDDTQAFRDKDIPVITIHSITQQNAHILHTAQDNLEAIDLGDFFETYRVVAAYLSYIDDVHKRFTID
jgi:Zn-dependent M28 family amino/carboxypeptidase